jgi:hypothetical protein
MKPKLNLKQKITPSSEKYAKTDGSVNYRIYQSMNLKRHSDLTTISFKNETLRVYRTTAILYTCVTHIIVMHCTRTKR